LLLYHLAPEVSLIFTVKKRQWHDGAVPGVN